MERPQHPCLTNPNPKSSIQPGIIVHHRTFQHRHLSKHKKNHPYDLETEKFTVHFFEFRGYGTPPSDVGTPGDIYIDMTLDAYALYAMVLPNSWKRWGGHRQTWSYRNNGKDQYLLIRDIDHPVLEGRMLWVTDRNVVWATLGTVRKDDRSGDMRLDASHFLTKLMEFELQEIKKYGGTRKRGAPDEGEGNCRSSKKGKVDKGVDARTDDVSFHSQDAHSATIVAPESMGVGTQISHLDTKIHTQEEQGDRKLEDKIHLPANNQKLKEELTEAYKTLTKAEQEHQSDDEDGLSIANTSCLHNDALHDLPDGVKNDLDAHIKNFLSAIKYKEDARRNAKQAEKAGADKDARIQTLLHEAKEHQSAQVCLRNEISDMAKQIQELVSERDQARAEEETAKKSLADKEARILLILKG